MPDKLTVISRIYFAVGLTEVLAECFGLISAIVVLKPLIPLTLVVLYALTSPKQNPLFYLTMAFSLITNIFFSSGFT